MAALGGKETASFDTLLAMNAVGIVEKIFLLLDRVSLEKCHHVCKAWNDVLSSEVFLRKKASLSKRMWMNAENLNHQVWARIDHDPPLRWVANGDEVACFGIEDGFMGNCTYINSEGERKNCQYAPWGRGDLWILDKSILIGAQNSFHFINKQSMISTTLEIPEPPESLGPFGHSSKDPYTHFNPATGLSIATLPVKVTDINSTEVQGTSTQLRPTNFIWLGQISMNHRQESEWPSDFNRDFVTDADGCSYFARVDVGNLTVASYSFSYDCFKPSFNEDGTRFILRGPEDESQLYVFALERENSRLLWRTGLTPLSEIPAIPATGVFGSPPFVHANSRNLFILNSDGGIKILNIMDGSVEKTLKMNSNEVWFWWNKITSSEEFLLAFLPSPPPHFEWNHDDQELAEAEAHGPDENNALDPDLVMIRHGTFELKTQLIRESQEEMLLLQSLPRFQEGLGGFGFLDERSIAVVPKCHKEGAIYKIKICHLDLEASKVFNRQSVTKSTIPFGTDLGGAPPANDQPAAHGFNPSEAIPGGYLFHIGELTDNDGMKCIKDFYEICTGVYIIEYSVAITRIIMPSGHAREGVGKRMHLLEIVSWKTEELPRALKEFLNARFQMN